MPSRAKSAAVAAGGRWGIFGHPLALALRSARAASSNSGRCRAPVPAHEGADPFLVASEAMASPAMSRAAWC